MDYRGPSGTAAASAAGYGTLNLRSDVDFGNDLSLVAELNNLTDRAFSPYAQLPGAERSINLFLSKTFSDTMLKTALLVLTLTDDGTTRVTLSEQAGVEECALARTTVTAILTRSGRPALAVVCGETGLRLTPLEHGPAPETEVNRCRVELPASGGFTVEALAEGETCTPAPGATAVHCGHSVQKDLAGE